MTRLAVIIAVALALVPAAQAAPNRTELRHSAAITKTVGVDTLCVNHWRSFLRSHDQSGDTAWMLFVTFAPDGTEVVEYAMADRDCDTMLRAWLYQDWQVAISLYYTAEMIASDDSDRAINREFYKLRKAFHIRRSVTISDFF